MDAVEGFPELVKEGYVLVHWNRNILLVFPIGSIYHFVLQLPQEPILHVGKYTIPMDPSWVLQEYDINVHPSSPIALSGEQGFGEESFTHGWASNKNWVVVSNIFYVHPYLGKMIQFWLIFFKGVETTN